MKKINTVNGSGDEKYFANNNWKFHLGKKNLS